MGLFSVLAPAGIGCLFLNEVARALRFGGSIDKEEVRHHMHATIHRYEGVNAVGATQVIGKVNETLVPQLYDLPGFVGCYLIEGSGVLSLLGLFDNSDQADETAKVVSKWITDERLRTVLPEAPKITTGYVVAHSNPSVTAVA
jgi:hypothetical protein